jgi:hypothetical protein
MNETESLTSWEVFVKMPPSPFPIRIFRNANGFLGCGPFGGAGDRWAIRWSNDAHAYVWTLLGSQDRSVLKTGWASTLEDAVKAADNAFEKRGQFD